MQTVPVQAVSSQQLQCLLGNQAVTLEIAQMTYGMFMNVAVSGNAIINGVICENLNRIVRSVYLGFLGDFIWFDTQGTTDPIYTGIGARYQLLYLSTADLAALGLQG
jgi:hypothetical protein